MQLESEANLRRAKQVYVARYEEYEKAKTAANRAEEEGSSSTPKAVDKKKRLEEEARNKVCLVYNTVRLYCHFNAVGNLIQNNTLSVCIFMSHMSG